MVRTEGEELEAVRPSLEGARDVRRDTDRVEGTNLRDLIAELDSAGAAENHVDLLRVRMTVGERGSLAGPQPEMGDAHLLGSERRPGHACFPAIIEPIPGAASSNVVQVDLRVRTGHLLSSLSER